MAQSQAYRPDDKESQQGTEGTQYHASSTLPFWHESVVD